MSGDQELMNRGLVLGLAIVAAPVVTLAACNAFLVAHERDAADTTRTLHREARALVPPGVRVIGEEESACRMLRSFPSCVTVFLDWQGSSGKRRTTLEEQLRARGWQRAPNRPSFVFVRDGLEAHIFVNRRGNQWENRCSRSKSVRLESSRP
jgi:hypothetical protein